MNRSLGLPWFSGLLLPISLLVLGCGQPDASQDQTKTSQTEGTEIAQQDQHDDMPADFAAGVAALKEHYGKIKSAFESGNVEQGHDPLHNVGHSLKALTELAKSAGLPEDQLAEVEDAMDKMFSAYGEIDEAMHAGEEPDYDAVSETLDSSMELLEAAAAKT